ncbi:MAG: hypothetical protein E7655_01610 [Ruminococcaceae bacterium]|nr:hypothetical protein [Oscillospiraceae bacterium]
MKTVPKLLHVKKDHPIPLDVISDLQLDRLLSRETLSVLQYPCGESEIKRRLDVFAFLEKGENIDRLKTACSALTDAERSLYRLNEADIPLNRYHCFAQLLASYLTACEKLTAFSDSGSLLKDISDFYTSVEKQNLVSQLKKTEGRINALLEKMRVGLLSLSDKNWLTPDREAVSEYDRIGACAQEIGLTVPHKKELKRRINRALSDAVCRLYEEETAEIEALIDRCADVDFREPLSYIGQIKFFLEIRTLVEKAEKICASHCLPTISKERRYAAKDLYDVSLLAKHCDAIVPNDADFTEEEPFGFLIGANGGGKTTYLRAVGINLLLFLSGCPVFAKSAEIFPFDAVYTHFPKDERFDSVGRLDEEKQRTDEMLEEARGKNVFLLFNETYSGTDEAKGFELLKKAAEQIQQDGHFGLYVTHFHDVLSLDHPILSAEVDLSDENKRTFRIAKAKGKASSYALDILKKYRLDKRSLAARREKA